MKRLLVASLIVGALAVAGAAQKKEFSFPHVKANGRATPEFYYQGLQVVVNYDYSQRNHKGAWLLIDIAAASRQRFVLHKGDLKVITPNGREIGVAPQQTMISDAPRITELVQNARIWRRDLISYFNQRTVLEPIRFQIAPPGTGTTSDESVVDADRVAIGAIFFKTPEGSWEAGTHRLEVNTEAGQAALPIKLD